MNPRDRLLERAARGEDIREEAARLFAQKKQAKRAASVRTREKSTPDRLDRELLDAWEEALYEDAKRTAFARAKLGYPVPRCEVVEDGRRCNCEGVDPDHVLGGAMKADSERLGAEGLQIMCRTHHNLKTVNSPTRGYWLDVAEEHALRHGYRRLLALIEKARARYEAKHPRPPHPSPAREETR